MIDTPRRRGKLGGIDLLAQEMADEAYRTVKEDFDLAIGDSPIEKLLFTALRAVSASRHRCVESVMSVKPGADVTYMQSLADVAGELRETAYCEAQVQVAGWRVDFLLHYPSPGCDPRSLSRLIVECDGHDFHERTKAQAARDRSRDRLAQHEGMPVFRFTGSEIWNDPYACADEILSFMEREPRS